MATSHAQPVRSKSIRRLSAFDCGFSSSFWSACRSTEYAVSDIMGWAWVTTVVSAGIGSQLKHPTRRVSGNSPAITRSGAWSGSCPYISNSECTWTRIYHKPFVHFHRLVLPSQQGTRVCPQMSSQASFPQTSMRLKTLRGRRYDPAKAMSWESHPNVWSRGHERKCGLFPVYEGCWKRARCAFRRASWSRGQVGCLDMGVADEV